jgi:Uma2 family endonuclease
MNEAFIRHPRPTTRAAEGLPRWSWSVSEIERLSAGGYFRDDDRFELVGGEIVPMSPKGRRHEIVRVALALRLSRGTSEKLVVASESQFNLSEDSYTVPDVLIHPVALKTPDVRGKDALLVVEVADTSLAYDRGMKARLYASHGVREYWVIDAATLVTAVYTQPSATGYGEVKEIGPGDLLLPTLVPACAISLATIDVD